MVNADAFTNESGGTVANGLDVIAGSATNLAGGVIDTVTNASNGTFGHPGFDNQSSGLGAVTSGVTGGVTNSGVAQNEGVISNSGGYGVTTTDGPSPTAPEGRAEPSTTASRPRAEHSSTTPEGR